MLEAEVQVDELRLKIEIALAVGIPEPAAFAAGDDRRAGALYRPALDVVIDVRVLNPREIVRQVGFGGIERLHDRVQFRDRNWYSCTNHAIFCKMCLILADAKA